MKIKPGIITALVTPFKEGRLDEDMLRFLINRQLQAGIDGLLLLGTTGESPTLSLEESKRIVEVAVEEAKDKVPLIIGTGSYSTEQTIKNSQLAKDLGADASLIITPYYIKPTQEGLYLHYKAVNDAVDLPIIIYSIPARTNVEIQLPTWKKLLILKNMAAIKECTSQAETISTLLDYCQNNHPDKFIYTGDDAFTLPLISLGGHGSISVTSNLFPEEMIALCHSAFDGDFITAKQKHYSLLPLFKTLFLESNPIPIKEALNAMDIAVGGLRLPLCAMQKDKKEILLDALEKYQTINASMVSQ
ncbi:MAG: 4-hydroxy-tetrahydrodipicolinate synthase [Parachlamydiales bacterium]|nr:4-hydroxy-tetrahydrodipicolinate synthase [Parachlamydiales bacterium]